MMFPDRVIDGEQRWHTIGTIEGSLAIFTIIHTAEERDGEEVIRIVSAREATRAERKHYEN
jgi:uncharacterized DUF497 family protein